MDDDVKELLEAAEAYRSFAADKLGLSNVHVHGANWGGIEAQFLFPQLLYEKDDMDLMVCIAAAKFIAEQQINNPRVPPWRENTAKVRDHYTTGAELLFLQMKQKVEKAGIAEKLTPVQRRVMEQHYMVVRFME